MHQARAACTAAGAVAAVVVVAAAAPVHEFAIAIGGSRSNTNYSLNAALLGCRMAAVRVAALGLLAGLAAGVLSLAVVAVASSLCVAGCRGVGASGAARWREDYCYEGVSPSSPPQRPAARSADTTHYPCASCTFPRYYAESTMQSVQTTTAMTRA